MGRRRGRSATSASSATSAALAVALVADLAVRQRRGGVTAFWFHRVTDADDRLHHHLFRQAEQP